MKKSRFTESQIVGILKEADSGVAVNEIWRRKLPVLIDKRKVELSGGG